MLMLIDLAGVYYRAFHAMPETVTGPHGQPVNAIRGTLDLLARIIRLDRPNTVVACRDLDWRPAWRVALVPSYKAHRLAPGGSGSGALDTEAIPGTLGAQVPVIVDLLGALGIGLAGAPEAEADDVIATLAAQAREPVLVVTGDRDLFQVVTDTVAVRYIGAGMAKSLVYHPAQVRERFGVAPGHYADFAALRGDSSDGLPGIKGIGDKTAAKLLARCGSLARIQAAAKQGDDLVRPGVRHALCAGAEYLHRVRQVVEVRTDCQVTVHGSGRIAQMPVAPDRWAQLVAVHGLAAPAARLLTALAADPVS